jgi:hypothetical protein
LAWLIPLFLSIAQASEFGPGAKAGINGVELSFSGLRALGKDAGDELDEYAVAGTRIGC